MIAAVVAMGVDMADALTMEQAVEEVAEEND